MDQIMSVVERRREEHLKSLLGSRAPRARTFRAAQSAPSRFSRRTPSSVERVPSRIGRTVRPSQYRGRTSSVDRLIPSVSKHGRRFTQDELFKMNQVMRGIQRLREEHIKDVTGQNRRGTVRRTPSRMSQRFSQRAPSPNLARARTFKTVQRVPSRMSQRSSGSRQRALSPNLARKTTAPRLPSRISRRLSTAPRLSRFSNRSIRNGMAIEEYLPRGISSLELDPYRSRRNSIGSSPLRQSLGRSKRDYLAVPQSRRNSFINSPANRNRIIRSSRSNRGTNSDRICHSCFGVLPISKRADSYSRF